MANFAVIPSNWRVPGFPSEISNAAANSAVQNLRTLVVGQKLDAGTAPANVPVLVTSQGRAVTLFGRGSMLARMCALALVNDPNGELWALPLADDGDAVKASGTWTFTGSTTKAGVFSFYIGGQLVSVPIASGANETAQTAAVAAAVNAALDLPLTASDDGNVITWTARNAGFIGNMIDCRLNFGGAAAGEFVPEGAAVAFANLGTGATDPAVATGILGMGDVAFDFVALPYADSASGAILDAFAAEFDNVTGRWSPFHSLFGHVYSVKTQAAAGAPVDLGGLVTFGNSRNDPHCTVAGLPESVSPGWEVCAAFCAADARSIKIHPAQPTQTLAVSGVLPPAALDRLSPSDRNTLLQNGIATFKVDGSGRLCIDRDITTYQLNSADVPDNSYLDSNTLHQLAYGLRYRLAQLTSAYPRPILVDSLAGVDPSVPAVSPKTLKAEEFRIYDDLVRFGIYQDAADFQANFTIARNLTDHNRIDEVNPPYLANQLRVLAALILFRV